MDRLNELAEVLEAHMATIVMIHRTVLSFAIIRLALNALHRQSCFDLVAPDGRLFRVLIIPDCTKLQESYVLRILRVILLLLSLICGDVLRPGVDMLRRGWLQEIPLRGRFRFCVITAHSAHKLF